MWRHFCDYWKTTLCKRIIYNIWEVFRNVAVSITNLYYHCSGFARFWQLFIVFWVDSKKENFLGQTSGETQSYERPEPDSSLTVRAKKNVRRQSQWRGGGRGRGGLSAFPSPPSSTASFLHHHRPNGVTKEAGPALHSVFRQLRPVEQVAPPPALWPRLLPGLSQETRHGHQRAGEK